MWDIIIILLLMLFLNWWLTKCCWDWDSSWHSSGSDLRKPEVNPERTHEFIYRHPTELKSQSQDEKKDNKFKFHIFISKGERECGELLREFFPHHHWEHQYRSNEWLLHDFPGRKTPPQSLELDWYCEKLKLAVEFNGKQHYEVVEDFHGVGPAAQLKLWGQQQRDNWKRYCCLKKQVNLITISYKEIPIRQFLKEKLEKLRFVIWTGKG